MTADRARPTPREPAQRLADPIAMEVFSSRLMSIVDDMLNTLVRASFSTNIKERRDCTVGLFDARGRILAQTDHAPIHLGSLLGAIESLRAEIDPAGMAEGDAFVCNDPYLAGGTHLPDITVVTPVFHDGALAFYTACIAHHADVGGSVPGSISGGATSIFQEGIRIPLCRIRRRGETDESLVRLIATNTRDPEERRLDLGVQLASNDHGAAMARLLLEHMGAETARRAIDDLLRYTGRRLAGRIAALPDGESTHAAFMDDDGLGGDPVRIVATARVAGSRLDVDFGGSSGEARGAMNMPYSALRATVYYVVKTLLDPGLMPNQGLFAPVRIAAPEGTIVRPRHPAAVGARSITANKVARAVIGALGALLPPDRGLAAGQDSVPAICFSGMRPGGGGPFVYLETVGGGAGATPHGDGMDGVQVHMTNTSNLPIEALEQEYGLMVDEYALIPDSGGAGAHRGGLGIARQVRAVTDGIVFSARSDGHVFPAPGLEGGKEGRTARLIRNPGSDREETLSSKIAGIALAPGESVRIETPGGGGHGAPEERMPHLLAADVRGGKVSMPAAETDYGASLLRAALKK